MREAIVWNHPGNSGTCWKNLAWSMNQVEWPHLPCRPPAARREGLRRGRMTAKDRKAIKTTTTKRLLCVASWNSVHVAQVSLELPMLLSIILNFLPPTPKGWDYRCVVPNPVNVLGLEARTLWLLGKPSIISSTVSLSPLSVSVSICPSSYFRVCL